MKVLIIILIMICMFLNLIILGFDLKIDLTKINNKDNILFLYMFLIPIYFFFLKFIYELKKRFIN